MSATAQQTIKVEFDPMQPAGRRHVCTDEDGPHFADISLLDAVVERAATMLAAKIEKNEADMKSIAARVSEKVNVLVDERVPTLVEKALSKPLTVTDRWGDPKKHGTLRELMVEYATEQLTAESGSGYGSKTVLSKVVSEEISYQLTSELSGAVKTAKKELTDQLRATAAQVIAKTITDGLRS